MTFSLNITCTFIRRERDLISIASSSSLVSWFSSYYDNYSGNGVCPCFLCFWGDVVDLLPGESIFLFCCTSIFDTNSNILLLFHNMDNLIFADRIVAVWTTVGFLFISTKLIHSMSNSWFEILCWLPPICWFPYIGGAATQSLHIYTPRITMLFNEICNIHRYTSSLLQWILSSRLKIISYDRFFIYAVKMIWSAVLVRVIKNAIINEYT
jgi:hypothetical protein